GREKDLTVFWVWELVGDVLVTRKVMRLQKVAYNVQLKVAGDLLRNQNILRVCGDATGIGDMLIETLQMQWGANRVEKVKFTAAIKEHLASLMLSGFQDRKLRVPDDVKVRDSFHSVRKTVTAAGNIRYDAARTNEGHADDFWAASLGKEAANQPVVKPEIIYISA
ncbi:MAG: hypothetical protein JRE40_08550, partial [Deltaproteobacteria bacterium]|nr:hypothetical protein [Deltaproteobacteria bacterium]